MSQTDTFSEYRVGQAKTLEFDPRRSAVLVVDMLNDFFEEGGEMVLPGGKVLYEPIGRLLGAARGADMPVFWLNQHLRPTDALFNKRIPHCLIGTWGAEIVDALHVGEDDYIIHKRRYSGFFQTDLDLYLREKDIRHVIVVGVVTNICVRSTVNDAYFLGYDVIVPEEGVMATSPRQQDAHLYDIDTHYGTVTTLNQVLDQINQEVPAVEAVPEA
jgi:ureidoacrylate peracid hydrolase